MILPCCDNHWGDTNDRMVELPKAIDVAQSSPLKRIIDQSASAVVDGSIALLGDIPTSTDQYSSKEL